MKKWTVRKDNRAQISILTSLCSSEVTTGGVLQRDESLSPRYTVSYTVHCYFNFRIIFSNNFQLLSLRARSFGINPE